MRKSIVIAAAAGIAAVGAAGPAIAAQDAGVAAGDLSLVNVNASDAAHWQVCGQNVLAQPYGQDCDNSDQGTDDSGVDAGALSLINADASGAAHWQVCGQNVGVSPLLNQMCAND
ncbi:hypothetical protein L0U85_11110 [Glycomyces sp. L485]|uniref:hypothetical protein n=1 Tax=Glycomyces sp. L485 TaxID=2909235 RepID=UPI001F4BA084|nr:hypothetical protein [Glycomyces sp. L485]MCH7231392.1 hypothetical protein [Glycomyces sp. L485]